MRYYFGQYVRVSIQWTDENGFIVLHLTIDASSGNDHKLISILPVAASPKLKLLEKSQFLDITRTQLQWAKYYIYAS